MKSFGWNHRFAMVNFLFRENLVGPSGLEPPTSCLSGTRSNHLSYEPIYCLRQWYLLRRWNHFVMKSLRVKSSLRSGFKESFGGDDGIRTHDPLLAGQVLSQLSYTPICASQLNLLRRWNHFVVKSLRGEMLLRNVRFCCFSNLFALALHLSYPSMPSIASIH